MAGIHSLYGMSKAAIFTNCHGALPLIVSMNLPPEESSIHAASGTCTHSLAERYSGGVDIELLIGTKETHDGFLIKIEDGNVERAKHYVDTIMPRAGLKFWEVKLSTEPVILVEGQSSTADCVVADVESLTLEVHDLKDGNGLVSAVNNDQIIGYLLAAMHEYSWLAEFKTFRGFIHQPKIDWFSETSYTLEELLEHEARFRKAVGRSQQLMTESPAKIRAALNPGDWCEKGWCRIRGQCPAREQAVVAQFPDLSVPVAQSLPNEQLGQLLQKRQFIEGAFKSWAGEAHVRAMRGEHIPGFKMVNGKQGPRKWRERTAEGELVKDDDITDPMYEAIQQDTWAREIISPTAAEKKLKSKHPDTWAALQKYIERSPGSQSLVPEVDNRTPLSTSTLEFGIVDDANDLIG